MLVRQIWKLNDPYCQPYLCDFLYLSDKFPLCQTLIFSKKQKREKLFIHGGYVPDFSNNTFQEFVSDAVRLNIYADDCLDELGGSSKGKRLKII